jgi:hypothetical protein
MVNLTKDQNQIGLILQQGNELLTSNRANLKSNDESQIKEQMKNLNRQWESLRSKSLDRQSM